MFRYLSANLRKISKIPVTPSTSTPPGAHRTSTSASASEGATNDATPSDTTDSILNQNITYTLKEFLTEYEKRTKEANFRMEQSITNKIESRVTSAESKITDAEHKMLYLIIGAVVVDWAKVTIEKFYDNKEKPNVGGQQKNQE